MGNCIYCGRAAGFMRDEHPECTARIMSAVEAAARLEPVKLPDGASALEATATKQNIIKGWCAAVERALDDAELSPSELDALIGYVNANGIGEEARKTSAWSNMVKGLVLRETREGTFNGRFNVSGLPLLIPESDPIIWAWPNVSYLEDRVRIDRSGGSQGVSIRIMKGVYYRVGAFKSRPVEVAERKLVDVGWLVASRRHLWFSGPAKSLKTPWSKIIAINAYSDGFGIHRDAASAKPQIFITKDGWFSSNLAALLAGE